MTELSTNCIDHILFPLAMDVSGNYYFLKAVVHCASHHFTVAINSGTHWLYYDDLCAAVQEYATFQDLLNAQANGWYFAVYEKYILPFIGDTNEVHL